MPAIIFIISPARWPALPGDVREVRRVGDLTRGNLERRQAELLEERSKGDEIAISLKKREEEVLPLMDSDGF